MLAFIGAVIFTVTTLPVWFTVALFWGVLMFVVSTFEALLMLTSSPDVDSLLNVLIHPFYQAFESFTDIPTAFWDFARYDHPWWAAIISFLAVCWIDSD